MIAAKLPPHQVGLQARCLHPRGHFTRFPKSAIEQSIPERFEKQVRLHPDRIAVEMGDQSFTYDELNRAANRVARSILASCGSDEKPPIGVLFDMSLDAVAGLIGVLKTGRIAVLLDPSYPDNRLRFMVNDAEVCSIVTHAEQLERATALSPTNVINTRELDPTLSTANLGLSLSPRAPYAIFYTSGSTDTPKGVVLTHRGTLYHIMCYTNAVHICPEDRLTLFHSLSFEASEFNLYGALLNGASLCPYDVANQGTTSMLSWVNESGITIFHSIPAIFRRLVDDIDLQDPLRSLRLLHLSGAPAAVNDVELYRTYTSPACLFMHRMGTTEVQNVRWIFLDKSSRLEGRIVPLGYQVEETEVLLLNGEGEPVADGEVGEIAVKSPYLSLGYWKRPELTQSAFQPAPEGGDYRIYRTGDVGRFASDNCLFHLGRQDHQAEVRGFRVEVTEIEALLLLHPAVQEAAIVAHKTRFGDTRLVAHVVPASQPMPSETVLRDFLSAQLPVYMLPAVFNILDALPTTPNGKLDRRALPQPGPHRPNLHQPYVAPRTPIEAILCDLWAEILELEQVGIYDSYFELGGNSLSAMVLASRATDMLDIKFPMAELLRLPTVADMALRITQKKADFMSQDELIKLLNEVEHKPSGSMWIPES